VRDRSGVKSERSLTKRGPKISLPGGVRRSEVLLDRLEEVFERTFDRAQKKLDRASKGGERYNKFLNEARLAIEDSLEAARHILHGFIAGTSALRQHNEDADRNNTNITAIPNPVLLQLDRLHGSALNRLSYLATRTSSLETNQGEEVSGQVLADCISRSVRNVYDTVSLAALAEEDAASQARCCSSAQVVYPGRGQVRKYNWTKVWTEWYNQIKAGRAERMQSNATAPECLVHSCQAAEAQPANVTIIRDESSELERTIALSLDALGVIEVTEFPHDQQGPATQRTAKVFANSNRSLERAQVIARTAIVSVALQLHIGALHLSNQTQSTNRVLASSYNHTAALLVSKLRERDRALVHFDSANLAFLNSTESLRRHIVAYLDNAEKDALEVLSGAARSVAEEMNELRARRKDEDSGLLSHRAPSVAAHPAQAEHRQQPHDLSVRSRWLKDPDDKTSVGELPVYYQSGKSSRDDPRKDIKDAACPECVIRCLAVLTQIRMQQNTILKVCAETRLAVDEWIDAFEMGMLAEARLEAQRHAKAAPPGTEVSMPVDRLQANQFNTVYPAVAPSPDDQLRAITEPLLTKFAMAELAYARSLAKNASEHLKESGNYLGDFLSHHSPDQAAQTKPNSDNPEDALSPDDYAESGFTVDPSIPPYLSPHDPNASTGADPTRNWRRAVWFLCGCLLLFGVFQCCQPGGWCESEHARRRREWLQLTAAYGEGDHSRHTHDSHISFDGHAHHSPSTHPRSTPHSPSTHQQHHPYHPQQQQQRQAYPHHRSHHHHHHHHQGGEDSHAINSSKSSSPHTSPAILALTAPRPQQPSGVSPD